MCLSLLWIELHKYIYDYKTEKFKEQQGGLKKFPKYDIYCSLNCSITDRNNNLKEKTRRGGGGGGGSGKESRRRSVESCKRPEEVWKAVRDQKKCGKL